MTNFIPSFAGVVVRAVTMHDLQSDIQDNYCIPKRAKVLALTLLDEGQLCSRTTNAELIDHIGDGWYTTKVSRAFADLKKAGYGNRKEGGYQAGVYYVPPLWTWHPDILTRHNKCVTKITYTNLDDAVNVVDNLTGEVMSYNEWVQQNQFSAGALSAPRNGKTFWERLDHQLSSMPVGELGEMRYNAIRMQRIEAGKGSKRAKFWAIQERIYAGELANREIVQPSVILRRLRTIPINEL